MTKRAISYARQSLDLGGVEASITRQFKANRALIESREWTLVGEQKDVQSGYTGKKRDGWEQVLLAVLSGQVDVIVAWALDRITRSMKDLEDLIELCQRYDVAVVTATGDIDLTTDTGRMIARILAAVARAEVERKAERQRLMWDDRAKKGGKTPGARAFGYEPDQMTIREPEAELIREAVRDVLAGISLGTIARRWNEAGVKSARAQSLKRETNGKWDATSVRLVLTNPRVSGRRSYTTKVNGEKVTSIVGEAQWPAIISVDEQEALVALIRSRRPQTHRPGPKPTRLLSGIMLCGVCKAVVRSTQQRGRVYYKCRAGCTSVQVPTADAYVSTLVKEFLATTKAVDLIEPEKVSEVDELRREKALLEERLTGLVTGFTDGVLTAEQMRVGTTTLRSRIEALESRLEGFTANHALDGLVDVPDVDRIWDDLPVERQRAVVRWLLDIELKAGARGAERIAWDWKNKKAQGA